VDAFNLQLQNLRYEVLHLRKEVSRCINFRSADEGIDLVPLEEFYKEADPAISLPDSTRGAVP
jgi:THO complex subunit 5